MTYLAKLTAPVSVSWNAFVAAFLYYTLLAAVLVGGANLGGGAVAGAYAVPPVMYAATLLLRLYRAGLAWVRRAPVGISRSAHSAA